MAAVVTDFWAKARREIFVGINSTLKWARLKPNEEDPDYLSHLNTLETIQAEAVGLRDSILALTQSLAKFSGDRFAVQHGLKDPHAPDTQVYPITSAYVQSVLVGHCIAPLDEFLRRLGEVELIKAKRWRAKELLDLETKEGPDQEKITRKYAKYHSAFIRAVDLLAGIQRTLFGHVFAAAAGYLGIYLNDVKGDLVRFKPILPSEPAPAEAAPAAE